MLSPLSLSPGYDEPHIYSICCQVLNDSGTLPRPQNLEKLSIEELHQRKHDLKQEDSLRQSNIAMSISDGCCERGHISHSGSGHHRNTNAVMLKAVAIPAAAQAFK